MPTVKASDDDHAAEGMQCACALSPCRYVTAKEDGTCPDEVTLTISGPSDGVLARLQCRCPNIKVVKV